jgi:YbbR domain-containing protein
MITAFQAIISYLKSLFFHQWKRKAFAFFLSIFVWFMVNQSLTTTRTILNIPIRVTNLPENYTIEGLASNGKLNKKMNLTLVGNKEIIDPLESSDLEIVVDAEGQTREWPVVISKKNLITNNPDLDLMQGISKVHHAPISLVPSKLVTEKINVHVASPTGEAPRGYQFLDIWPYKFELNITGPEEVIKRVKYRELKLAFNLSDVTKKELDKMSQDQEEGKCKVVSFPIPDSWKIVNIPSLSDVPITISDPQAKLLRMDFIRYEFLPIETKIPIQFFFHSSLIGLYTPFDIKILCQDPICHNEGLYYLNVPLYASGVDKTFIELVKDHIQIVVDVNADMRKSLNWSAQVICSQKLEDSYVETLQSGLDDEDLKDLNFNQRQEYLRNRFRSYMQRIRLFHTNGSKLYLQFKMEESKIIASMKPAPNLKANAVSMWDDDE